MICPVLLQDGNPAVRALLNRGTPSAYLLDSAGRVASELATGAGQVRELAERAARAAAAPIAAQGLASSKIERGGLAPGTLAPALRVPDLKGAIVDLADYLGKKVLLVFSDVHCGPCEHLAPQLAQLHREQANDGNRLVVVGRGDLEENRRKASEYGWDFPVVVQRHWELSRAYGIFATPVAFLIGEDGRIAKPVARGAEEIMSLAAEG